MFPNGLKGDLFTKELLDIMIEGGLGGMNLSLEHASPRMQKVMRKNLDVEKFRENIQYVATKYPSVVVGLYTMHGFPTETEEEALMLVTSEHLEELGGLEGESGNPGYASDAHGVVNLCGAIGSLDWIDQPDKPIVSMHGDQDGTVPYSDESVTLFGLDVQVYGSYSINEKMNELGNYSALHTYVGQDHVPFTSNLEFEAEFTSIFLYDAKSKPLALKPYLG